MSKWWKCDLQVATPAWNFSMPADEQFDLGNQAGRRAFAERYMEAVAAEGVDVIALADHNCGDWIDVMVAAGRDKGIIVFPGCEITTGTGADGIHLIIIGNLGKTSQDFDRLLAGCLGFDEQNHPRFHHDGGNRTPGSSGKTLQQILDSLPDEYLVIAPHALTDNGIGSAKTVKGDLRWKALHHPRLVAIDPGDCSSPVADGFNDRFRRRDLADFPRLNDLAFVATSDAYCLDDIGRRFSWIRMEAPSLEGLRQAFLDREARVICDWDPRLNEYPDKNPNNVRHGWLREITLHNVLGNSTAALRVPFVPGLNVIIGGRGSGKSTVVAAIRQLYSGYATLPASVRTEAEGFAHTAFEEAVLSARHHVAASQEEQSVVWHATAGLDARAVSQADVATGFRVRVVNQKELFARVSFDPHDPLAASRSFLSFVDESLGILRGERALPDGWQRRRADAASLWADAAREYRKLKVDLEQLPSVRAKIKELSAQVSAFDSESATARRERIEQRTREYDFLTEYVSRYEAELAEMAARVDALATDMSQRQGEWSDAVGEIMHHAQQLASETFGAAKQVLEDGRERLKAWYASLESTEWWEDVRVAQADEQDYLAELRDLGLDPNAYVDLRQSLARHVALERELATREKRLQDVADRMTHAWRKLVDVYEERRRLRSALLTDVGERSSRLRFDLSPYRDVGGWVAEVRDLLNLRADGFLDDVPTLADWLWSAPDVATRDTRWRQWRDALVSGDFRVIATREHAEMRATWQRRLESLDEVVRLRLATAVPDDAVEMRFLRDDGSPEREYDWQDITQGSPGQRTAAMLAFVLHHGTEPLVLDQPEDDLDTEWLSRLVVKELRASRWKRQLIVVTHNANIPVNGDAERVIVLENRSGVLRVRASAPADDVAPVEHVGAIENRVVREDIQNIMEGGVRAFVLREQKYNNEVSSARWAS
jgi:energy-coupling factor transporter ATP-binding protein EcfA2